MGTRHRARSVGALAALLTLLTALTVAVPATAATPAAPSAPDGRRRDTGFVTRVGTELRLDGRPFHIAGSNNYYPMYKSRLMVDDVFADAAAAGFNVLRIWGSLDIGDQDGSNSVHGKADGVYFQYFDGTRPAYNDGADGLEHLDYVLWRARESGVKVVVPFVNNWRDFGGMDQYVRWAGGDAHDDFYTDPVVEGWYRDWISHLLNRVNTLTGVRYADDPTIMTWELGNEPRCKGSGVYPTSPACTTATITSWADEMTRYVKSLDRRHLVSVGDEGFYCVPGAAHWTENCGEGVDTLALTRLPAVDVMSFHLYPDPWGTDAAWGTDWIARHVRDARRLHKASMLGEFGLGDKGARNPVYREWTDTVVRTGGNGFLYWILSGIQDDGTLYPDFDGYTVYCPSPVCQTLTNASKLLAGRPPLFGPVADDDAAVTEFGVAATLTPASNDVAYLTRVAPGSIDLDPAAAGRQSAVTVAAGAVPAGAFAAAADGTVTFTPADGFAGRAVASYTIRDRFGRLSNTARLTVTVKPDPTAAVRLFSFEDGVEGWAPGNWQVDAGTVAQSADFHSDGAFALRVDATGGGWFGANLAAPADLAGKSTLRFDLQTGAAGTSTNIAVQVGDAFEWCQGAWGFVNGGTTTTVVVDLLDGFSCDPAKLADTRVLWVWISPGGAFHLDNVRAE
jgi:mannan endo-1,4-beta-mannosidase